LGKGRETEEDKEENLFHIGKSHDSSKSTFFMDN